MVPNRSDRDHPRRTEHRVGRLPYVTPFVKTRGCNVPDHNLRLHLRQANKPLPPGEISEAAVIALRHTKYRGG